jgi:hypothetical protein
LVSDGFDPNVQRQTDKATLGNTFEVVAREWLKLLQNGIKASMFERERSQLQRFVFPDLGTRPIAQITTPGLLAVLKKIEARGVRDTRTVYAVRVCASCAIVQRIFRTLFSGGSA